MEDSGSPFSRRPARTKKAKKLYPPTPEQSERQLQIASKLTELETLSRKLRREHNSLSPISLLPTELLARSFQALVLSEVFGDGYAEDPLTEWTVITRVCHLWRTVALGCPALWVNIPIYDTIWIEPMLARSKKNALNITADTDLRTTNGTSCYPKLRDLLSCDKTVARICELDLADQEFDFPCFSVESGSAFVAPLLRSLRLARKRDWPWRSLSISVAFGGVTPLLHSLTLQNTFLPWDSSQYRGLTRLEIGNLSEDTRASVRQMTAVLSGSPLLRSLNLDNALRPSATETENSLSAVALPFLESFTLLSEATSSAALLRLLDYPPGAKFDLFVSIDNQEHSQAAVLSQIFSSLSIHLHHGGTNGLAIPAVEITEQPGTLRFEGFVLHDVCEQRLRVQIRWMADNLPKLFKEVRKALPVQTLKHLALLSGLCPGIVLSSLGDLPNLRTLTLKRATEETVAGLSNLLLTLYPALKCLTLKDSVFGNYPEEADPFRAFLVEYKRAGGGLEMIQLVDCEDLSEGRLKGLREVLGTVSWESGFEENGSDDSDEGKSDGS